MLSNSTPAVVISFKISIFALVNTTHRLKQQQKVLL